MASISDKEDKVTHLGREVREVTNDNSISSPEIKPFIDSPVRVADDNLRTKWVFWRRRRYILAMLLFLGDGTKSMLRSNMSIAVFPFSPVRVADDNLGTKWFFWRRRRYILAMLLFLGDGTKSMLRSNMSIAVFPMTENHSAVDGNGTSIYVQDFDWDVETRGFLLSTFFYGFVVSHIPGGILAVKYGGARLYGLGIGLTAFTTLLTPLVAYLHFYALIALRVFEGMCEGLLAPSVEIISSRWIPMEERSFVIGIISTGIPWGDVVGNALSSAVGYHLGWPAIFYVTGGIGIIHYLAWLLVIREFPTIDKKISASELRYINSNLGRSSRSKRRIADIPFLRIFTCGPVIATIIANTSYEWSYTVSLTQQTAFIKDVLGIKAEHSGYITSLTFCGKMLSVYLLCPFADFMIRKKLLSVTRVRKIYICGTLVLLAVISCLIQQTSSVILLVSCLISMQACAGIGVAQITVNTIDIAAVYCSVVSSAYLTLLAVCGIVAPVLTGYLTRNKTVEEWNTVYSIQAGICILGAAMYCVLAGGDLQPWAADKDEVTTEGKENSSTTNN